MRELSPADGNQGKDFRFQTLLRLCAGLAIGAAVAVLPLFHASAQNPDSGTIHSTDTTAITWTGTHVAPGGVVNDESKCVDGVNCETFTLTVAGAPGDWAGRRVQVLLTWQSGANERSRGHQPNRFYRYRPVGNGRVYYPRGSRSDTDLSGGSLSRCGERRRGNPGARSGGSTGRRTESWLSKLRSARSSHSGHADELGRSNGRIHGARLG